MDNDIENIISLLDAKSESGTSRITLNVSETQETGSVQEQYHHGRCDVGSPWATGKIGNFDCRDWQPED
ncbi:MAG: hypothetical protein PUF12_06925 [Thermoflexaceae bacterium]|nr:hypothetical protein [Thermoflexaceae bacterium]